MENQNCPDFNLCQKLKRHIHGREYFLYTTRDDYKRLIDNASQSSVTLDIKEPGFLPKMASFGGAMIDYVTHGFQNCSKEEAEERLACCEKCEFYNFERKNCLLCGCNCGMKSKIAREICPHPSGDLWAKAKSLKLSEVINDI